MNVDWAAQRALLKRWIGRRVAERDDVDDLVQDVLLRAHEAGHRLRDPDRAPAWLGRVAANRVIDHYRARRPHVELPEDLAAPESVDDPVQRLASCLPAMVEQLPPLYRDALRLAELQGLAQRDVARRLDVTLSGAKSRIQRGRERLRALVEACCAVLMTGSVISDVVRRATPPACAGGPCGPGLRLSAGFSVEESAADMRRGSTMENPA